MSIAEAIGFAIRREQEAQEIYLHYARSTDRTGFRQLLLSMVDMEKEHERKLSELVGKAALDQAFRPESFLPESAGPIRLSDYLVDVPFSADMEYGDFLLLVIKKEERAEKLYQKLLSMAADEPTRRLFSWLADEERRHKAWAQDRYDQDILKDN
jgi:rubrerythrin